MNLNELFEGFLGIKMARISFQGRPFGIRLLFIGVFSAPGLSSMNAGVYLLHSARSHMFKPAGGAPFFRKME